MTQNNRAEVSDLFNGKCREIGGPFWHELSQVEQHRLTNMFDAALSQSQPAPQPDAKAFGVEGSFQSRVQPWMMACFGPEISADKLERGDRFIEEAIELVQSGGYPKERVYALVEYVYGRDQGEVNQEVGGVMVTLAAYCLAHGVDMHEAGETELARVWTKVEAIRAKQAAKPTGSALPVASNPPTAAGVEEPPVPDWIADLLNRRTDVEHVLRAPMVARKKGQPEPAPPTAEEMWALADKLSVPSEFMPGGGEK